MEATLYEALHRVQQQHWWYVARRAILDRVLASVAPSLPSGTFYDLGCGVGANLSVLERYGTTIGIDSSPEAVQHSRERGYGDIRVGDLNRLEDFPEESASLVLLADVIEHLDHEEACLLSARRLLKPGGVLVVTVPALMLLWSSFDRMAHHRRRYTEKSIRQVVGRHFDIERTTYFNTLLFAPVLTGRLVERLLRRDGHDEARIPPRLVNSALSAIFSLESRLVGRVHLPVGVSLLCIARKPRGG